VKLKEIVLGDHPFIYLIPISDMHIGDPNFNEEKFLGYREWVLETPEAYVILNGDIMNSTIKDSVGDIYHETMNPQDQLRYAKKVFEPIKDRILAIVRGNHELRIAKSTGIDTSEILAAYLGVWYAGDEAFIKLKFGHRETNQKPMTYTVYCTHGWGAGRTAGGKVNNLQKLGDIVIADVYIASHTHFMTAHQDVIYIPDERNNKITPKKRTFVSSGAFLDRGGYAIQKGYPPCKMGSPRLRLDGARKDVHASL
jgi:hypothetical protein